METSSSPRKKRINHEHREQVKVVNFLERQKDYGNVLWFTANVRETYTGSYFQNNYNYAAGVRKGLSDLLILVPEWVLFVELKRPRNVLRDGSIGASPSAVRSEQLEFIELINKYGKPLKASIAYGHEEAIAFISSHLKSVSPPTQTDAERHQSYLEFQQFIHGDAKM